MTGGGGGGYGGGSRASTDCTIVEPTALNSVQQAAIPQISVGQKLDVDVVTQNKHQVLVARLPSGQIVGSLTPPSVADILNCINMGHSYVAVVLSIQPGALVRVEIRPK